MTSLFTLDKHGHSILCFIVWIKESWNVQLSWLDALNGQMLNFVYLPWAGCVADGCLAAKMQLNKSLCLSVYGQLVRMHAECFKIHTECSRMHAECSRVHAECSTECMQNVPKCYRMYAEWSRILHACIQLQKLAPSYKSLHLITWACMQVQEHMYVHTAYWHSLLYLRMHFFLINIFSLDTMTCSVLVK